MNGDIDFLRDVTAFISRQYQHDTINLLVYTTSSLGCQLALLLAFHAQSAVHLQHGMDMGTDTEPMDVTQEEFAAMLGCSRQSASIWTLGSVYLDLDADVWVLRHGQWVKGAGSSALVSLKRGKVAWRVDVRKGTVQRVVKDQNSACL